MGSEENIMNANKGVAALAVVIGILLLALAFIYFTHTSGTLPSFFPGYEAGSTHKHAKHGLLALALAIVAFLVAWFQSGPRAAAQNEAG